MVDLIEKFNSYCISHPNLTECWLTYLELKKRHYSEPLVEQCEQVLTQMASGCDDLKQEDIVRILLYKRSL